MGLFSTRLIDSEVVLWQLDWLEYLIDNLSTGPALPDGDLWLPIQEHFGHPEGKILDGAELAHFTFERILEQTKIGEYVDIDLVVSDSAPTGFVGPAALLQNDDKMACGFYQVEKDKAGKYKETITIDSELTESPTNLIATLAHELGHAMHNRTFQPYDGEPELYELFTDLTAVYLGYGVFLANSRFEFGSNDIGWQAKGAGYLPESDLVFATALFMKIKGIDPSVAYPHLKPRLTKMLGKAFKQLKGYETQVRALQEHVPTNLSRPS